MKFHHVRTLVGAVAATSILLVGMNPAQAGSSRKLDAYKECVAEAETKIESDRCRRIIESGRGR